ncbi:ABC transporter permease [Streptomyces sp. SID3212]|uniref:ABC transporter permease n=1 Tax=Streptomyces sp. SID3212 TaxID=2690259 RepID=UPI00136BD760|nr:ABC transporter permease [Streptomyces sp. SID3212]MYV53275.1 ABC transporter permease subunit [Streptomyces sp. SID3212]
MTDNILEAPATPGSGQGSLRSLLTRRLLTGVLVLAAVSAIVFVATEAAPGDAAAASLGPDAAPETVAARRAELGLDRTALVRYGDWLLAVLRGDLGTSYVSGTPVSDLVAARVGNSLVLAGVTLALLVPLAVGLGIWAGLRAGGLPDRMISATTLTLLSVPEFVTGTILVLVFAVQLDLLPAVSLLRPGEGLLGNPDILVLPVVTLLVGCLAHNARLVRAGVVEVATGDAVTTARLNGVPEHRLILRYVLPAALPPVIPLLARYLSLLVGGALVAETLFGFPGIASVLVQASAGRDVPTVQAVALLVALVTVLANLLGDVLGTLLDPLRRIPQ